MSKQWGIGAWAAEAEREEEEERRAAAEAAAAAAASSSIAPTSAFPSLSESRSVKPKKKKAISLAEFTTGKSIAPGSRPRLISDGPGLTAEEMLLLPKGPRDRSGEEEEERGGLGGGFANYGGGYDRGTRQSYERERERERERDEPSRADESDNWGSMKKPVFSGPSFHGERRGSRPDERFSRSEDRAPLPSRADEVDNWGSTKKPFPTAPTSARRQPSDPIRQPSRADEVDNWLSTKQTPLPPPQSMNTPVHDTVRVHSRGDEVDSWLSSKQPAITDSAAGRSSQDDRWGRKSGNQPYGTEETRRRLVLTPPVDFPVEVNRKPKPNPFGSAKPREEVLAERGLYQSESASKESGSRPSSSHSVARPETPEISSDSSVKPKPKPNPFGSAKPRELVLEEKGMDWRKIDFELEHRAVDRPETEEETILKEQIKELIELSKQEAEGGFKGIDGENLTVNGDEIDALSISERLQMKEKELEQLTRSLDDKVRFSQKAIERAGQRLVRNEFSERPVSLPGSRPASLSGSRPGSRSGRSDSGRNYDLQERPGSQSERRSLESSENPQLQSLHKPADRPWSFPGKYEGGRNRGQYEGGRNRGQLEGGRDANDRRGSWSGSSEHGRSFSSLQRLRQNNSTLPAERGSFSQYPQEAPILDNWNRPNGGDRDGRDWRSQSRINERGGVRRF